MKKKRGRVRCAAIISKVGNLMTSEFTNWHDPFDRFSLLSTTIKWDRSCEKKDTSTKSPIALTIPSCNPEPLLYQKRRVAELRWRVAEVRCRDPLGAGSA